MVRLLATLPEQQRKVVVLRYYADLSEQAAADALNISVGSVKSAASRGLATLRTQLAAHRRRRAMSTDTFEDELRSLLHDTADAEAPAYVDVDPDAVLAAGPPGRPPPPHRDRRSVAAAAVLVVGLVGYVGPRDRLPTARRRRPVRRGPRPRPGRHGLHRAREPPTVAGPKAASPCAAETYGSPSTGQRAPCATRRSSTVR